VSDNLVLGVSFGSMAFANAMLLRIDQLTSSPVLVRFRSTSRKLKSFRYFHNVLRHLRKLHMVWIPVWRRVISRKDPYWNSNGLTRYI